MVKKRIKAASLVLDYNIYQRHELDDYHVREIKHAMEAGVEMPPVVADKVTKRVVDGFHRVTAALKGDPNATILVTFQEYASDGELFQDSMQRNAGHGRNLTKYDKARCGILGQEFGLTPAQISTALNMTGARLTSLLLKRTAASGEVLKQTTAHFAGKAMTPAQERYSRRQAGGLDQLFYINQVVALVESGSVDLSREKVVAGLAKLRDLLADVGDIAAVA